MPPNFRVFYRYEEYIALGIVVKPYRFDLFCTGQRITRQLAKGTTDATTLH